MPLFAPTAVLLVAFTLACVPSDAAATESAGPVELVIRFSENEARPLSEAEREVVHEIARAAMIDIERVLSGTPERIELVVVSGTDVIPGFGSVGRAASPRQIWWTIDPLFGNGSVETARAELRATLFHEVHHLVRGWTLSRGTAGRRMIDAVVAEGMATAFERDQAGWDPPWGRYPPDEVDEWVEELGDVEGLEAYGRWMFLHPDGRRWIGYRAGTYVTDRAMEACDCTAADLVRRSTDEVLELSGVGR